jgi:CDP-paratose 2-epimerase
VRAVINRCGVIAGPWQMGRVDQGIVALWLARHLYGLPLTYIGYGGKQVRDALHIEDLADLIEAQLTSAAPLAGQVLPVGGGRAVSFSLIELTELASRATGRSLSIASDDRVREGDIPVFLTDAGLADRTFGWKPARSLEQIIDDTARWLRDNRDALRPVFGA